MKKQNLIFSMVMVLIMTSNLFAHKSINNVEEFDINSVDYVEEELEVSLGFDAADYLPEGFNPYEIYFDINSLEFIEDEKIDTLNLGEYLPKGFDAYANPTDAMSVNYINEDDTIELDFDSKQNLSNNFNPYKRK
ncbi:MAG: hypothetical protein V3U92_09220 [Cellulophaga sp.]